MRYIETASLKYRFYVPHRESNATKHATKHAIEYVLMYSSPPDLRNIILKWKVLNLPIKVRQAFPKSVNTSILKIVAPGSGRDLST